MILGTRVVDVAVLLSQIINGWTLTTRKRLVILSEDQTCQLRMSLNVKAHLWISYEPFTVLGHAYLKKWVSICVNWMCADEQDQQVCDRLNETICCGWWPNCGLNKSPQKTCEMLDANDDDPGRRGQSRRGEIRNTNVSWKILDADDDNPGGGGSKARGETRPSIVAIFTCGQWQWHHPDLAILIMYTVQHVPSQCRIHTSDNTHQTSHCTAHPHKMYRTGIIGYWLLLLQ